jgi:hypothetical protein
VLSRYFFRRGTALTLKGDGKGRFTPLTIMQSGIYIPGSGKALAKLKSATANNKVLNFFKTSCRPDLKKATPGEIAFFILPMKNL